MENVKVQTTPDDSKYCEFCMRYVPEPCFTVYQAKRCMGEENWMRRRN